MVAVIKVEEGTLDELVHGPARIQTPVPVTISARVTAAVIRVEADIDDKVRKGQVLVRLDACERMYGVDAYRAAFVAGLDRRRTAERR